jgi:hypothetical protein
MNTNRAFRVAVLALFLAAPSVGGAARQTAPDTSATVFVGGTELMRVRVAGGGYTPAQRAQQIQERVNTLLGKGTIQPDDITVPPRRGEAVVLVKGQLLLTADNATARFNQMTPRQLAEHWAARMRAVLPTLTQPK